MCWLDKKSLEQMLLLRDKYQMKDFVETGTFRGVNVRYHSFHWRSVFSCDIDIDYLYIARQYNKDRRNVFIENKSSPLFLKKFVTEYKKNHREDIVFFFLDAHFYDPDLPPEERWVVVNELKALKGFKNCVICIHDFDCSGLGHCCYDGRPLGFPLVLEHLKEINENFYFYVNDIYSCCVHSEESIRKVEELVVNELVVDTVRNANSNGRLRNRGILYCTPSELDLKKFVLRRA